MRRSKAKRASETGLQSLMNVGPAIEGYLVGLGIASVPNLAKQGADTLYRRLQRQWGRPIDPCVYDTFCAIIHEARTGEKTPWYAWTPERKRRVAAGDLDLRLGAAAPPPRGLARDRAKPAPPP